MHEVSDVQEMLESHSRKLSGLTGLVLAGTDGRPVAHVVPEDTADATAAVSASSLQLARRLADLLGDGELHEIVVRSANGYVIVLAVGTQWVLVALTVRSANVARLNLAFRDLVPALEERLQAAHVPQTVDAQ